MRTSDSPAPRPASRRRWLFTGAMLLIPVLFFVLLEGGLRLFGYGDDYPLFEPIEGYPQYLVQNREVARRYFAQQTNVPTALHDVFDAEKGADEYRIFVQGGSTAAGFPFYHGGAFSRMLEHRLQQTFSDRKIEVINTAMAAVNSYTLLDLADEIIAQRPDAVLIYAGHNEYYGALGVGSTESLGPFRGLVNTYLRLRRFRTVQLLRSGLASAAGLFADDAGGDGDQGTLMSRMVGEQVIPYGSTAFDLGRKQFEANLSDLLAKYERAGIPVFVATLASNERDQRPFETVFAEGTDRAAWQTTYERGLDALRRGDASAARTAFAEATQIDSLAADAFYALARAEEVAGDTAAARTAYIAARDRDALRFRAPEAFNDVIREVAAAHGATVVEAQANIRRAAPGGIVGEKHMLEHLHPTVDGYFLLADAFYDSLREAGAIGEWRRPIARADARRDLLLTPADSLVGILRVRRLKSDWPFVPRGTTAPRQDTLTLRTGFDRVVESLYQSKETWLEATEKLATFYEQEGDARHAVQARKAMIASYPMIAQPYIGLGGLLMRADRLGEAQGYFNEALERDPNSATALSMLGAIELQRRNTTAAIDLLERARARAPRDPQLLYNLSGAYALSQRFADARATAEALLAVQPNHARGRALLASLPPAPSAP
ncbi:MAG: tetratricopeptide repeat protein [Rhodothermales bacterium]